MAKVKTRKGYRGKGSYVSKDPIKRAKQMSGLKNFKGVKHVLREDDLRYKIKDDLVKFVQKHFYIPETHMPVRLLPYEKEFFNDLLYRKRKPSLALLGTPKKCGKSTIASMLALFVLCTKRDAEIYIVGPDLEQSTLVVYSKICKAIRLNSYLQKFITVKKERIYNKKLDSFIRPLACSSTNAGLNPSLTLFDELWRFTSTEAIQAFDELTNTPFKDNLNLIVTYAGHAEDEDSILYRLYKKGINQREGVEEKDKKFLFRWYGEELYEQIH